MTSFANATVLAAVIALCLNAEKEPRSPLFTNSWQTIRQALDQFEADVKIEALPFGFDDEDHDHFTFTQAAWFAAHVDEEGDPMPRPQYDAPGVFPAETAAQNVWNKNANQYYAFMNYPPKMAQKLQEAMGPVIYQQFLSSTFNVADGFKYANMKSFITDKFNVQMRPQLLVQGLKNVNQKMGATITVYDHYLAHRHAVAEYDFLRGEVQSPADQVNTYKATLSNNPLALAIIANTYQGGVWRNEAGEDYTDPSTHTVQSMQACLQRHMTNRTTVSAPFAAAAVDNSSTDAMVAAITANVVKALGGHFPPRGSGRGSGSTTAPRIDPTPPAMVPLKNGTLYCQWCGYFAPGKTYGFKKHPTPHNGANCPNLTDAAWRAAAKPTAQQKAATTHCDCKGKWTGFLSAQA